MRQRVCHGDEPAEHGGCEGELDRETAGQVIDPAGQALRRKSEPPLAYVTPPHGEREVDGKEDGNDERRVRERGAPPRQAVERLEERVAERTEGGERQDRQIQRESDQRGGVQRTPVTACAVEIRFCEARVKRGKLSIFVRRLPSYAV